jgi:hypothetical protein
MPTNYTPQLGLSLPTQGELTGTWGDVTNTSMTGLVDTAIAGTTTLSGDADVTLTANVGVANQARAAVILCNGARTLLRNITAPATSKVYTVINATTGGFSVVLRGVGPTAGVTVPAGQTVQVAWNGADFVIIGSALLNNPALIGVPTAPTAAPGTSTTQIATTAFVTAVDVLKAPIDSPVFTGNPQAPTPTFGDSDTSIATTGFVAVNYAPINSPTFTGVPLAPTPTALDSSTKIATTAFVNTAIAGGTFAAGSGQIRQTIIATAGQTVFTLIDSYVVGGNRLNVFINGVRQNPSAYTETNSTTVTFSDPLNLNDAVLFETILVTVGSSLAASSVFYNATAEIPSGSVQDTLTNMLPLMSGNTGKFLTTNGTTKSWAAVSVPVSATFQNYQFFGTL